MSFKDFAIETGKGMAETASNGLVGMGLSVLGNLFGLGRRQAERQHQYELEKMEKQAELNKEAADYSQELAKQMWEYTGYGNQIRQMKENDINPALLYNKGGGQGQSTAGGRMEGVSQGVSQAIGMGLEMKRIQAETMLANAQARKTDAEAEKIKGVDTLKEHTEIDLMKDKMKLNQSLREMYNATGENQKAQADKCRQEILNLSETLKGVIINNEINKATKDAQIREAIADSNNAITKGLLMESEIDLNRSQEKLFNEKVNNFFYQIYTDRIKANAQMRQAGAAEMSADAAFLNAQGNIAHAVSYEDYVREFAKEVESNKELREIIGNKLNNEIVMEWLKTGITSITEIADLIFTKGKGKSVKEIVKRTYDEEGKMTGQEWTWQRERQGKNN